MLKLLYVDDDEDIRHIVGLSLGLDPTIDVRIVGSAAGALAEIDRSGVPDVMLLDVMMPEMDGPTLLCRLRQRSDTAAVPVIFMTAKARPADIADYRQRGAIGVIMKPFDPVGLAAEVRATLAGAGNDAAP